MIKKFDEFIFEGSRSDKEDNTNLLLKLFNEKPIVKTLSKDERGAYSLSGIKKYFRENGKTNDKADDAFYLLKRDKSSRKIQSVNIKDYKFNETIPHFFIDLSEEEIDKIKSEYEKDGLEKNKDIIEKNKEAKKARSAAAKEKRNKRSVKSSPTINTKKRSTARKTDKKN